MGCSQLSTHLCRDAPVSRTAAVNFSSMGGGVSRHAPFSRTAATKSPYIFCSFGQYVIDVNKITYFITTAGN